MTVGFTAFPHRLLFGERKMTELNAAQIENWENIIAFVAQIVDENLNHSEAAYDRANSPRCLIDLMITSSIYEGRPDLLVLDLILVMMASVDTSRNNLITTLCHLAKNDKSREKVRGEIQAVFEKSGKSQALNLGHEELTQ